MKHYLIAALLFALPLPGALLKVGPGQTFSTPCAAVTAAMDGDIIEVAAGEYVNDFCVPNKALTIRGVGGRAHIRGTMKPTKYEGAAVWVASAPGKTVTFENMEFSGGTGNGNTAALRIYPGTNGILRNVVLHDSEACLMQSGASDFLLVEDSEIYGCGNSNVAYAGQTHNIYVSQAKDFTFRRSYSHDVTIGHLLKSRASRTVVDGSRLEGAGSYEVDCSQGGDCQLLNSTIVQRVAAENVTVVAAGLENPTYAGSKMTISGSTITDYRPGGRLFSGGAGVTCTMTNTKYLHTGGTVGACTDGGGNIIAPVGSSPPVPTDIVWQLVSGVIPPGLTLSAAGLLSGMPTTSGTFVFSVSATKDTVSSSKEFTVVVKPANPPAGATIIISTVSVPGGTVGLPYSAQLAAVLNPH